MEHRQNRALIVGDDTLRDNDAIGIRECLSKDRYDQLPAALWRYGPAA